MLSKTSYKRHKNLHDTCFPKQAIKGTSTYVMQLQFMHNSWTTLTKQALRPEKIRRKYVVRLLKFGVLYTGQMFDCFAFLPLVDLLLRYHTITN